MKFRDSNLKRALKNIFCLPNPDLVVIEPHLGLGDNLICLALMRELSVKNPHKRYYYACLERCYHSLSWMFSDLSNVCLFVVKSGREARQLTGFLNGIYLPIGVKGVDIKRFDAYFYEQHQIDFELRWTNASTNPGPLSDALYELCNPLNEVYMLICDQESGLVQYDLKITNPQNKKIIKLKSLSMRIKKLKNKKLKKKKMRNESKHIMLCWKLKKSVKPRKKRKKK
jgi:hypothetical protein